MSKRLAEAAASYNPANALSEIAEIRTMELRPEDQESMPAIKHARKHAVKQACTVPKASTRATEALSIRIAGDLKADLDTFVLVMKKVDPECSMRDVVHASIREFIDNHS